MLEAIEFSLDTVDGKYSLVDKQGANLGDIDEDVFTTAEEIIDRLDIYIYDCYLTDLDEEAESCAIFDEYDMPNTAKEWIEFVEEHSDEMKKFKQEHQHEFDVLDMICNHLDEVDLKKIVERSVKPIEHNE